MYGIQKCNLGVLSWNFFSCSEVSHKLIVNNLKRFEENFMVAFFVFRKKSGNSRKLAKSDKNYIKSRNATIKLSLNRFKLSTICLCDNLPHVKHFQLKTPRLHFLDSIHLGVFRKSIGAKVKVSSNHLKFCKGCIYDISKA